MRGKGGLSSVQIRVEALLWFVSCYCAWLFIPDGETLALFLGHSHLLSFHHLQCADLEGKALEIWSCAVMSGRQRVDRLGPVLMKDLDALSCDV